MTKIGFIGLGNMGGPMAVNLVRAGHELIGYDLTKSARQAFVQAGGQVCTEMREVARDAEIIITMLPSGSNVREVYLGTAADGLIAAAKRGSLLIDCSTIDVETARQVAAQAEQAGLLMLDAPVSGGTVGASAGNLTFMVGGSDKGIARATPFLEVMGKTIIPCGASGNGQAAKICNNMILGISMIGVSEAFSLAEHLGLEPQKLFDVAAKSSGQCWALTTYCPVPGPVPSSPANREYKPGFSAAMMTKDLRLAQQAVLSNGANTPLGAAAAALFTLYCNLGHAEMDFSGIIKMIHRSE